MEKLFGDLVFINLSTQEINREPCPETVLRMFLGGRGLGTYILLKYLDQHVQPLAPENILVFATGLLTGTEMISSSRLHICTRSPLTGFLGTSNVGGDSAHELSLCQIGALIVTGKADHPVSIRIHDKQISIEDASAVWGLTTVETYHRMRDMPQNGRASVISIGPAGEHLCSFASIMSSPGHFSGRTGTGAVMGSKLLKSIVAYSTVRSKSPHNPKVLQFVKKYLDTAKATEGYKQYSTVGSTYSSLWLDTEGASAVRNFQDVRFEVIDEVLWAARSDIIENTKGCYKCPLRCKADLKVDKGRHKGKVMERPEFESMVIWGPKCGSGDGREIVYLHNLCNEYGIDSIEAGNMIAFAIDLFERGILSSDKMEGMELRWGNIPAMEALLKQIVYRNTWLGDTLANGIRYAVQLIGNDSERYAFAVKGLTLTGMDPRGFKATALGYAVSPRGADFSQVYAAHEYTMAPEKALQEYGTEKAADRLSEEGKALMVRWCMSSTAIIDSIGLCKIPQLSCLVDNTVGILAKLLQEVVNFEFSAEELFKTGERIINAERLFVYKFGATRQDDTLPEKFLKEPIPYGASQGSVVNLEAMLQEYYSLMMWDEQGNVTPEKIQELGLEQFLTPIPDLKVGLDDKGIQPGSADILSAPEQPLNIRVKQ